MRLVPRLAFLGVLVSLPAQGPVRLHRDHVLGTSLELVVRADAAAADAFLSAVLTELTRLEAILSGWRQDTPVAALGRGETVSPAPVELVEVLRAAESVRNATNGAFDVRLGSVAALWTAAMQKGKAPEPAALERALAECRASGWTIEDDGRTVKPIGRPHLALDGIAKGYAIDRALQAARAACPKVTAALLDVGGDQVAFGGGGDDPFQLGIADPKNAQDNGRVMLRVPFAFGAAATSGGYARGGTIDGTWRSQVIDPGFGQPATGALQATVTAPDAATADALATAFCVLPPEESLQVARRTKGVECLVIDGNGRRHATAGFAELLAAAVESTGGGGDSAFPGGRELEIALELPKLDARRYERPYVAVWIEDGKGAHVATLALWGRNRRWVSELTNWWKADPTARDRVDAIGRASRGPGQYRLVWNGCDDAGSAVAAGEYTVVVEVSREHGGHTTARQSIRCADADAKADLAGNRELAKGSLRYAPREAGR